MCIIRRDALSRRTRSSPAARITRRKRTYSYCQEITYTPCKTCHAHTSSGRSNIPFSRQKAALANAVEGKFTNATIGLLDFRRLSTYLPGSRVINTGPLIQLSRPDTTGTPIREHCQRLKVLKSRRSRESTIGSRAALLDR